MIRNNLYFLPLRYFNNDGSHTVLKDIVHTAPGSLHIDYGNWLSLSILQRACESSINTSLLVLHNSLDHQTPKRFLLSLLWFFFRDATSLCLLKSFRNGKNFCICFSGKCDLLLFAHVLKQNDNASSC